MTDTTALGSEPGTPSDGAADAPPEQKPMRFPTAFTVLAVILAVVWVASFFIPAGEVVVQNDTGEPVMLDGCGTPFVVVLSGEGAEHRPVSALCLESFTLPLGESRWPVTVHASYSECASDEPTGTLPRCEPANSPPPLPPGSYTATVTAPAGAPVPPPLSISVTPMS